jgi:hypothetical protein
LDRNGKTWPGLANCFSLDSGLDSSLMVFALS